ncbi:uncharacterized protein K02A2.6-like [Dendronephthya gigantea]|uniref:uncharacterized protein K02A2.6-like n=1 Tax=Dendronephthya gigantea TaxID=151771 RepID=UPI00106DA5FE|nr:uncharacterized protein K02A2.6-like [Dendronephthya gigantea]
MPKGPWEVIHADFYGPLPSGEYLLVVIDRYSRYPEVEIVSSTKASTVIPKLDKMFATHGIPDTLKTDNGPPFNGEEYRRYVRALGIKVLYSTPYWPQGNSEAERFMQPLGKALRTAKAEGRPWRQELNRFLLQYRTTPHSTTKVPPSELIFNRVVKGKLPMISKRNIVNRHKQARENDKAGKEYNKQYADNRRKTKHRNIAVGDSVLVRQRKQNKLTTNFDTTPYRVIGTNRSQVTAQSKDGHKITRNVSHFKRIPGKKVEVDTDVDDEEYKGKDAENAKAGQNNSQSTPEVPLNIARRSTRDRRAPQRYGNPLMWK